VAETIGLAAREGRQIQAPRQPLHDARLYIVDPNGYGVEVFYELSREV
jgi:hypothetical protein